MYINQIFELSMILDNEKFQRVLSKAYNKAVEMDENEDEYTDRSLVSKGITIVYRNSQYKKKVNVIINSGMLLNEDNHNPDKFVRKLDKRISEYFDFKYRMGNFTLSGMILSTDIDVCNEENVEAYLKVIKRIGRVKGFSPSIYDYFDGAYSFCLDGNSNGIKFLIYNLENYVPQRLRKTDIDQKKLKSIINESKGILRVEIKLTKVKAIRTYTKTSDALGQVTELIENRQDVFLDTFTRIIPFGNFYKKDKANELIRSRVKDSTLRRRMLRLVALIPEKKSLYLAQKELNCRSMDKVMKAFAKINVSPVTISKRQDEKRLKNIYEYLCE